MVVVTGPQSLECAGIVADDHRVHALSHGDLPSIVLTHPPGGASLTQGGSLGVLVADGLPTECAKGLAHRSGIRCALEHLGGCHWRNPQFCSGIACRPCPRRPELVRCDLVEEIDDK